ncbi:hypothetical protein L3X38_008193 [Prunus dulcis]|uniref:Uncharacterized protein n=1 Tax=Prunus dulcis TaxID=3755 RepID=A0AAD4ZVZ3_PRUDU|nr:hypothetical protein L3X38_008193 [Prunus dulcis]
MEVQPLIFYLRPLFITANFRGVPIPKVMVDGGAAINLLPHRLLSKMGRTEKDLIPTRLTVTNFAGDITKTHGILDVDVIVGTKELKIAFFVVDTTSTTYNALLGRDWIHQSLCVPSTLHQQLALRNEEGYMEIVEANPRPFLPSAMCFEVRYYHDDLGPFTGISYFSEKLILWCRMIMGILSSDFGLRLISCGADLRM